MKIITITLNPAFDVHCSIADLKLHHENLAEIISTDAGGKGVNISRALTLNGHKNLAFVVLGNENRDSFERALNSEEISYLSLNVDGRIRENITCHTEGAPETRISFKGFDTNEKLLEKASASLLPEIDEGTIVTFTGRVPEGIGIASAKAFLRKITAKGAKLVIDSRSFALDDLRDMKPWLIKPNQEEISEYLGKEVTDFREIVASARELHNDGIQNVTVSLGASGAMLVCDEGIYIAKPPRIHAVSTIGAGDSSIAGFLAAEANGLPSAEKLRLAVAYGSAACLTEGTKPPRPMDISFILSKTECESIHS